MRRPLNKYAFVSAVLSSATPLFLGYDLAVVSSTAVLAEADLKLLACIVVVSSLLGALGAMGAQRLIGDRCTVLLSAAVLCAGALARGLATSFAAFTAGIFINGVGMGLALIIVPAYAAELNPSWLRGVLTSHPDGFVYLGCILGSLCYSTGFLKLPAHLAWRLTVASGTAIPALLSFAVLLMPDSPRWLMSKGHVTKARRVLSRTSTTLEEAELRLLEIKAEFGAPHDGYDDTVAMPAKQSRWREEYRLWLELLARPTEPLRRAVVSALVAKVFQQASGIGPMFQYVQRAFRNVGVSSNAQMPRALVAFGLVVVASFSMSLVLVEFGWMLVTTALAGGCLRRAPTHHHPPHNYHGGAAGTTRRQEQLKWARGLSATMLLSLTALVWIALGPAQWADASSRGYPQWLRTAAAAVNRVVSSAIFSSFVWVYEVTAVHGNLLVCPVVLLLVWLYLCVCLLGSKER